jgi:hypothetical protein
VWKFDPRRKQTVETMFMEGKIEAEDEVPLASIMSALVGMASPQKQRYVYKSVEPTSTGCCSVCKKELDRFVFDSYLLSISQTD